MTAIPHQHDDTLGHAALFTGPGYQAYRILQIAFVAAPVIAGLDKFLDRCAPGRWPWPAWQPTMTLALSADS